jgi:phosphohistidine phosphatase
MIRMNKTLILVRHSKAENRNSSLNDFDRSLTEEGKSDTVKMGNFLLNAGIVPDFIITSSAVRAYETASIFADVFKTDTKNIKSTRNLYYCSAKTLLDQIYGLPETINCLLVVSHNPGISDLTRGLSAGKSFYMDNTQVTFLTYDIKHWYQVGEVKPARFESYTLREIR